MVIIVYLDSQFAHYASKHVKPATGGHQVIANHVKALIKDLYLLINVSVLNIIMRLTVKHFVELAMIHVGIALIA